MTCKYIARDRRWGSKRKRKKISDCSINTLAVVLYCTQINVLVVGMKKDHLDDLKRVFLMLKGVHLFELYKLI